MRSQICLGVPGLEMITALDSSLHFAPTPACMGWHSMNRYAQELRRASGKPELFLLPLPPVQQAAGSRAVRALMRGLIYPLLVWSRVRSGVLHVLDHSFADLLRWVRPGVRVVVTLHDLIPLVDSADMTQAQLNRYQRVVAELRRADRIVCVSEHTKGQALRLLGLPKEKLCVIPNGCTPLPAMDTAAALRAAALPPYILSVGSTQSRKNLGLLPAILQQLNSPTLVRIGPPLPVELAGAIRNHATLLELGRVSDSELAAWYQHAALTLVPSTEEGFGLPVLEAMGLGCPVVCSNAASLPEAGGTAAHYFAPQDASAAAQACALLLENAEVRSRSSAASLRHAAAFTWESHWQGLTSLYSELLSA